MSGPSRWARCAIGRRLRGRSARIPHEPKEWAERGGRATRQRGRGAFCASSWRLGCLRRCPRGQRRGYVSVPLPAGRPRLLTARVRLLGWRRAADVCRVGPAPALAARVSRDVGGVWRACGAMEYFAGTPETTELPPWLGVHAEETHAGRPLSWTGRWPPSSSRPHPARLPVSWAGARPAVGIRRGPSRVLNGQVVDAAVDGTTLPVPVRDSGSHRLGLVSRPLRPWRQGVDDQRERECR